MLEKFIKSYSGSYRHTAMIRHKGMVLAFAMDDQRRIFYTVLDLGGNDASAGVAQQPKSPLDVDAWQSAPTELIFPNEIAEVGFGVADQTMLPVFKKNGAQPEVADAVLPPGKTDEYDYFKSTTARLTELAPFQVLTDGRYVYVFRQAIEGTNAGSMVYVDEEGNIVVDKNREKGYVKFNKTTSKNEWTMTTRNATPLVNSTLLVDRFLLVGTKLTPKMEVRFQRSRSKTRPASRKDSLGPRDLDGNIFYEPTQELRFIGNLKAGRFSVLLLPTAIAEIQRWQIFAENGVTGRMDSYNVERSDDGLFNTRGSQVYTCLDHPQVYARRAGNCSECGKVLIPRIVNKGYSESAMEFDGVDDHVRIPNNEKLNFTKAIAVEAWIKPDEGITNSCVVGKDGFSLYINEEGRPEFAVTVNNTTINVSSNFEMVKDTWVHIAGTFDGNAVRVIVNGNEDGKKEITGALSTLTNDLFIGRAPGDTMSPFAGTIDEVRIWKRARSSVEIKADMHQRLTGLESDLAGYWRFDEGYGHVVRDHTDHLLDGTAYYDENRRVYKDIKWTQSDAPVGEHPGMERISFQVAGRTFASRPTSLLYYQQSKTAGGYSGEAKPLKNTGRVMLAVGTSDGIDPNHHIAALDFGVSASGRLGQIPDELELSLVNAQGSTNQSLNDQLDRLSGLQTELASLNSDISRLADAIARLQPLVVTLDHALNNPASITANTFVGEFSYLNMNSDKLKAAYTDLVGATVFRQTLDDQLNNAGMYVYEHASYGGRSLGPFTRGFIGYTDLNSQGFNDIISSIRLDESLQVVVYEHANRGGASAVFSATTDYVGESWNDKISSMEVQENPVFKSRRDEAARKEADAQGAFNRAKEAVAADKKNLDDRLAALAQEKNAKEMRRATIQRDLSLIQDEVNNGASAIMPRLRTDPLGLTISGGLLGFAWTDNAPLLFDSATGSLALYFRGRDDQFFVAYFDTFTERARISLLSNGRDAVSCFSRSTAYDKVTMEIEGEEDTLCTVTVVYGNSKDDFAIKETWSNVPREARGFSAALNGQASGHTYVGTGRVAKDGELALSSPGARRAVSAGAVLMVGNERIKARERVFPGDTRVHFEGGLATAENMPVFHVEYDYPINAVCEGVRADLSNGSMLIRALPAGNTGLKITNQTVELVTSQVCKWTAAAPGSTLAFDGKTQSAEPDASVNSGRFDVAGDLTLEAWVKPDRVEGKARVIEHHAADSRYMLALEKSDLMSALTFDGNDAIEIKRDDSLSGAFTVEAWVKPSHQTEIIGVAGSRSPTDYGFDFKFQGGNKIHGDIGDGAKWLSTAADAALDYVTGVWYHVAYVVAESKYTIYVNGIEKGSGTFNGTPLLFDSNHKLNIGYTGRGNERMKGAIDEVRIWKRVRTPQEIQTDMNRRLNGNETDLVGYWHFENREAKDYSRYQKDGTIIGDPKQTASPLPAYTPVVGVGDKYVKAREIVPAGSWAHLAAAFDQAYGLEFDGKEDYLDCGNDPTLDINQDLTIEVFLEVTSLNRNQVIIRRGQFKDGEAGQHLPYSLSFNDANKLEFSFEDVNQGFHSYASNVLTAEFHKVAVTRQRKTQQDFIKDSAGNTIDVKVWAWDAIAFYVDGQPYGVANYESTQPLTDKSRQPVEVGNSNKPVIIGKNLSAKITEIRVWNTARAQTDIGKNLTGNEKGLVSWWRFQEGRGNRLFDSKSQNHATIHGAGWVKSPDPQGSSLKLYINGQLKDTDVINAAAWAASDAQFMLGARKSGGNVGEYFQGELEETRIWQTTRTEEQIQDNLFRRIAGEKEDLIAYYTFDAEAGDQISDYSLRGNHLEITGGANPVLSTAPIGNDTPQVRSALAGIRTRFSWRIGSAPAVQEYGDMQFDNQGNLNGVFKRCYSFILDGKWQIVSGYKVGDMVTEWIGQAQFAPQLIGFIEGAPPVPSENMTAVDASGEVGDYNQASSIELVEAQETTYTYSATKEGGRDMEVDLGLKFGIKSDTAAGLFLVSSVESSKAVVGFKGHFEASWGWSEEASAGVSRATGKTTSLELRGRYTTPEETTPEREPFGRRFVPDNVGLALVQSETADVFALRLKHNGALIAFQMRPNPDIPKDWNIIHFPINPRYTKQGTLDGKIGPIADADYPNALTYSPDSSYFKPIEAYALKNRIMREEAALETYYAQYAAQDKGRPGSMPSESAQEIADIQALKKLGRNLFNTYVWTTDGGLFAETQQTMDVKSETYGGSYDFKGMGGIEVDISLAFMKVAGVFELSAMFGGHSHLSVSKSRESKTSFEFNVNLDKIERDIYRRDPNDQAIVLLDESDPKRPKPIKYPYKVDAYRFMSFYLEPESDHYEQFYNRVIDPIWLEQSDDPGAAALRQARNDGKKPACWRVMHRVTYISRVLPPLDLSAPPSLEKTLQTLDIDSNYELIRQMEPYVRDHLANFADFSTAVDDSLKTYLPELFPHRAEIKEYLSLYYGIDEGYMPEPQVEGFGEGPEGRPAPNKPPMVKAGQYPDVLLLTGTTIGWSPDPNKTTVRDDRIVKTEDLFLTWEFLPTAGQKTTDVTFEDPHILNTEAKFMHKGMYRLRLTASDGILSASDETTIVVNEAPVIESAAMGKPARKFTEGKLSWDASLECRIRTGLGDPSTYRNLKVEWSVESGLKENVSLDTEEVWSQDRQDEDLLHVTKPITFSNSGYYLLKCVVDNGIKSDSQINLEIAARVTDGLQALYTFEAKSGATVYDVSGIESPLDLFISNPDSITQIDGGLALQAPTSLFTEAERLVKALKASNALTLEAWVKPTESNAQGLRRILTLSNGPAKRNLILAQNGSTYHVGLRTTDGPVTDFNASLKSLVGGVTDVNRLAHVVFTRDAEGNAQLFADGESVSDRTINGDFSRWDENFRLALGNEFNPEGRSESDRAWLGEYHLVAIYDRALSADEIKQNFEFGADRDLPPQVFAGDNREINWSVEGVSHTNSDGSLIVQMHGRITHDRPSSGSCEWTKVSGPRDGIVTFDNAQDPQTKAYFSRSGEYKLRLTANDGKQLVSKEVTVKITHEAPEVSINITDANLIVTADKVNTVTIVNGQASLKLDGAIENSLGNEYPVGKRAIEWACDPKDVDFADKEKLGATVTFPRNGVYKLTLTAINPDEKTLKKSDTITITVNQAPLVDAGPDQTLYLFGQRSVTTYLDGTVSDDGLPKEPGIIKLKWSVQDAQGRAKIKDAAIGSDGDDFTDVQFKREGVYILKLEADDGAVTVSDTVTINVKTVPDIPDGGVEATVIAGTALNVRKNHEAQNDNNILYRLKNGDKVTIISYWHNENDIWVQLKPDEKHTQKTQWCALKIDENIYLEAKVNPEGSEIGNISNSI